MISRQRCHQIARDWVLEKAHEEYERRLAAVLSKPKWWPNDIRREWAQSPEERAKLQRMCIDALTARMYDPPYPEIPSFFQRLRMNDWTPAEPTSKEWRMCTAKSGVAS